MTPYDVIVWATGFDTHAYVRPMSVVGVGGVTLSEMWGDADVYSYRGVALPHMPNFFILCGPFSPVNNVTVPQTLDDELGWICEVLAAGEDKSCAFAPGPALTGEFVDWLSEAIPQTVWADGCVNWYQSSRGLPVIWPWYDKEQTDMFRDLQIERLDPVPSQLTHAATGSGGGC